MIDLLDFFWSWVNGCDRPSLYLRIARRIGRPNRYRPQAGILLSRYLQLAVNQADLYQVAIAFENFILQLLAVLRRKNFRQIERLRRLAGSEGNFRLWQCRHLRLIDFGWFVRRVVAAIGILAIVGILTIVRILGLAIGSAII